MFYIKISTANELNENISVLMDGEGIGFSVAFDAAGKEQRLSIYSDNDVQHVFEPLKQIRTIPTAEIKTITIEDKNHEEMISIQKTVKSISYETKFDEGIVLENLIFEFNN